MWKYVQKSETRLKYRRKIMQTNIKASMERTHFNKLKGTNSDIFF